MGIISPAFAAPLKLSSGSSWSSGSQRPRVTHPAKPFKHTHPHHDPRPLSEEMWSAQGQGRTMFSKTVVVPRKVALSQSYTDRYIHI